MSPRRRSMARTLRVALLGLTVALAIIGAIVAVAGGLTGSGPALVLGIMIAAVGYLTWITQDVIYRLMVTTPEGQREAFITKEQAFADRVAALVCDAIVEHAAGNPPDTSTEKPSQA